MRTTPRSPAGSPPRRSAPCTSCSPGSAGNRARSISTKSTRRSPSCRWRRCRSLASRRKRSTCTAAPAPSATPSARRARASSLPCSGRCARQASGAAWQACASAAAKRPPWPSNSPEDLMASKIVYESPRFVMAHGPGPRPDSRSAADIESTPRCPLPMVVGCPRSGTSLLAVMLDSHPDLAVPPETAFLSGLVSSPGPATGARRHFFNCITADRIPISNWSDFGLDRELLWQRLSAIEPFTVAEGLRAFYALYAESQGKPRYGDKTPGYVFLLPQIAALLPE